MTETVIKMITQKEAEAAEIKAEAVKEAALIASTAAAQIKKIEKDAEESAKAYRQKVISQAEEESEIEYGKTLEKSASEAKAYCESLLPDTDRFIGEIVRRICRGDS